MSLMCWASLIHINKCGVPMCVATATAGQLLDADMIKSFSQRLAAHINSSLVPVERYVHDQVVHASSL